MNNKNEKQEDYWHKNFNNLDVIATSNDLQINIARTKNGERIKQALWDKTVAYFIDILDVNKDSSVIELCCGNGVIIGEFAKICRTAVGIDYSKELLKQLTDNYKLENLTVQYADVNVLELEKQSVDTIIIYFSIQHFNEKNSFLLIKKSIETLKVGGKILIGDIPDLDKKWSYVNKPAYHLDYFKRVLEDRPKIGYWFQKDFFRAMNSYFPNTSFSILEQPNYQINSDHCFDLLIKKNEND